MLGHPYKIRSWGQERTGGQEDCVKYDVGVTVVAKRNRYDRYEVFNELVCMNLGRILGLPIPIGLVLEKDGEPYYCSANIALPGGEFPPADLEHLASHQSKIACGIALFDAWICNTDRHDENVFYNVDNETVWLIDHGISILGANGIQFLRQYEKELKLKAQFAQELFDFSSFCYWYERLVRIPEHTIEDTVVAASKIGIDDGEARLAGLLLSKRRSDLRSLFRDNMGQFPKYQPGLFDFQCKDDPVEYTI